MDAGNIVSRLIAWWKAARIDSADAASARLPFHVHPSKKFLHVGCGPNCKPRVGPGFLSDDWREIRLDIDADVSPDIVASMLDMNMIADGSMDAIYSSHNIEHLYPHEVASVFKEFLRVLDREGILVITCPDLLAVAKAIVQSGLEQPIYESPSGPVAPLDVLYGFRPALAEGRLYMAHHMGFCLDSLTNALIAAGFASAIGKVDDSSFSLWVLANKSDRSAQEIEALAKMHLPMWGGA
ncbi:class I SAM-dependent methyltransferase [Propionivibrio dicarboxylicus]|uniref:Methyltransferase domain-containing protein n=1 Tax=Propionivibrio dicarboxylicus TaxID=83767 RepID=A0A1G8IIK9_9RHOO|nr:methyltransferase domain-containing protein [Propionivibrio dicarboxylicus]SDI18878.1 Methyltransferase domain-containing protein [Propionivibrio dicarboxylicus]